MKFSAILSIITFSLCPNNAMRLNLKKSLFPILFVLAPAALSAREDSAAQEVYTLRTYDARIQQGIDLIYSLKFEEADRYFEGIIAADQANPLGHFFLAMVTWWRVLIDLESRDHDKAFYSLLERCIEVCDRRLKQDPMDFDAVLFKAGAIGFRGRLRGDRNQYLRAAGDGLKSLPLLETSRKLEPANKDILFGQGIYNYFAEVVPREYPVVRPIMWLLPDGDRKTGLRQLQQVAREGRYARTEAIYFLAQIYRIFEKDKHAALKYLEQLYRRYPDNALFHRYLARTLIDVGQWNRGTALYEEAIRRSLEGRAGYHRRGHVEALYYVGRSALYWRSLEEAKTALAAADSLGPEADGKRTRRFMVLANLMLGKIHDVQGERGRAVERYERVLGLPDFSNCHEQAREYLKEPYRAPP